MGDIKRFVRAKVRKVKPFATMLFVTFGMTACLLENQSGDEIFTGGQVPAALEQQANPPLSDNVQNLIRSRLSSGTLTVAVIDSGVDYTNPDLTEKIAYDWQGSRITGAGKDILGNDNWAAAHLINPDLFAFGARAIENKLITGPVADPLALIKQYNDQFIPGFIREVQRRMRGTLFAKLNADNISLYGLGKLFDNNFPDDDVRMCREADRLHIALPNDRRAAERMIDADRYNINGGGFTRVDLRFIYDFSWPGVGGQPRIGKNSAAEAFFEMEGCQRFVTYARQAYNDFKQSSGYGAALVKLAEYKQAIEGGTQSVDSYKGSAISMLATAHSKDTQGYRYYADPSQALGVQFCVMLSDDEYTRLRREEDAAAKKAWITQLITARFDRMKSLRDAYREDSSTPRSERLSLSRENTAINNVSPLVAAMVEQEYGQLLNCGERGSLRAAADQAQAESLSKKNAHPYLSSENPRNSHGSHVAGIISAQHQNIRIYPVRITTQSQRLRAEDQERLRAETVENFTRWVHSSGAVRRGLAVLFAGQIDQSHMGNDAAAEAELVRVFTSLLNDRIEDNAFNIYFVKQLAQAVEEVGRRNIPIANVSLGMPNNIENDTPMITEDMQADRGFNFALFELFKYLIAEKASTVAAHTLFVVAAGNEGSWADGLSRSAFPCDMSSGYFARYQTAADTPVNNRLDNILCVGSLNNQGQLSSYTNLTFSRVPFVLALGETWLSTVKTSDCSLYSTEVSRELRWPDMGLSSFSSTDRRYRAFAARELGVQVSELEDYQNRNVQKRYADYNRMNQASVDMATRLYSVRSFERCYRTDSRRGYMSGTSMASPAVAGYMARQMLDGRVASLQNPRQFVDRVLGRLPTYGGQTSLSGIRRVVDLKDLDGRTINQTIATVATP